MKKFAIAFIFASSLAAQVQLGKNVQIGATSGTGTVTQVDTDSTSGISGGPITGTGTVACEQGSATQFGCVKPDGTTITASAGVLSAVSSGGGSLLPSGTALLVGSFSGLNDDGDIRSRDIGVPSSVNCVHTTTSTCTIVFGSSHGLTLPKAAVDMTNLSSWPNGISGANQQGAQYGSFQVTTVPNSTTITFTTPTTLTYTCGPCTGHIFDATGWGIWQFAFQPGIMGVATVYQVETTTQSAAANVGTWLAAISGSPKYYIDQTGQNDFGGGRTVAQVNADHQTVWAAVHTAGAKVLQSTIMPAQYGLTGVNTLPMQSNWFEWTQARGITDAMKASGQYVDLYADPATANLMYLNSSQPTQTANQIFASTVANVLLTQASTLDPPVWGSYSSSGLADDVPTNYIPVPQLYYGQDWAEFAVLHMDAGGFKGWEWFTSTSGSAINNWWNNHMNAGDNWCSNYFGRDATTNDYSAIGCFHYAGSGSSSNYAYDRPTSAASGADDYIRKYPDGTVSLPGSTGTTPSTSPICPNGTNGTLTTSGCVAGTGDVTGPGSATADDVATFNGTTGKIIKDSGIASTNIVTAVTPSSPITASITGHTLSVACPTCGTGSGGTSVSQNSGAAETNLPITGFMPQFCSDTSASGTAQVCNTANTFTPQTGNTIVYSTTTTNSGTGLTVNVNSLGAKSVAVPGASGWTTTLTASQIPANKPLILSYDGTNWNVQQTGTVSASGGSGAWTNISGTITPTGMTCTATACTASAASTITFASIPSTGNHIVIKLNYVTSSGVAVRCQLNGDTASTSYAYQGAEFNLGGTTQLAAVSQTSTFCGAGTTLMSTGTIEIPFYTVTARPRGVMLEDVGFASQSSTASNYNDILGGLWNNTSSAVNSIKIFPASGTITGSFAIYLVN